jgi:uncharacterized protein YgbK (DUF1537 family)
MTEPQPIEFEQYAQKFPLPWSDRELRGQITAHLKGTRHCIVALDDDPTGTQTVHDIWVVTQWDVASLRKALAEDESAVYILTNSRSLSLAEARDLNREIAKNLVRAAELEGRPITVVSRSDSTLRGHYPGEVDALQESLVEAGMKPFDGVCIIPFFPEGGRFTSEDVHWVLEGEILVPAAQTPYARDRVFGYSHSHLPSWVEEKTRGRVKAAQVTSVGLDHLRSGGPDKICEILWGVKKDGVVIVNALEDRDLEVFVWGLMQAEEQGKHFLFRTAASFVKIAAGINDQALLSPRDLVEDETDKGGLVIVGSYVPKSSAQMKALLQVKGIADLELSVRDILVPETRESHVSDLLKRLNESLGEGRDVVVYTSRELISGSDHDENITIGQQVSAALVEVLRGVEVRPRYLIAKGGITSSDLAKKALEVRAARVLGQVLPGVPVWKLVTGGRWPGMPYVVFPGNVGSDGALADIVRTLRR